MCWRTRLTILMKGCLSCTLISCTFVVSGCGNAKSTASPDMRPDIKLTAETAGLDAIAGTLLGVFDKVDVIALGEAHRRKPDSDLRIALVRHPDFPKKVRNIIVEFANSRYQATLDRYIAGGDVPLAELQPVWQDTTQVGVWDSPLYAQFFAAVREVNLQLSAAQRLRVLAGDPPIDWTEIRDRHTYERVMVRRDEHPAFILRSQVLARGQKALLIYGSGHLYRTGGITKAVHDTHPGKIFVVGVMGGNNPVYEQFDKALSSSERPVLVSLRGTPFGSFSANAFLGGELKVVKGLSRRSPRETQQDVSSAGTQGASKSHLQEVPPFQPNATLADVEDACVYLGRTAAVDDRVEPGATIHNNAPYQSEIDRRRRIIAAGRGAR
jgi:uncharacterized iron-regulated protein